MGKEGQETAQDHEEEVILQATGEETELQQKMLQVRDRDKGSERKCLVIPPKSLHLLAVSWTDQTTISQMDFMLWALCLSSGAGKSLVWMELLKEGLLLVHSL